MSKKQFSLFYSNCLAKKIKNFYRISRRFISKRIQICKKKLEKSRSVPRSVSNISMIISGFNSQISNFNILNERCEKLYFLSFLFLVPRKVVSFLLFHFNLFFVFEKITNICVFCCCYLKFYFIIWKVSPMIP